MEDVNQETTDGRQPAVMPCLCANLRQASRAVTRIYDAELRGSGLRSTQHSVLRLIGRAGEVRQGDLGELACLDETTLTRSLRPLEKGGWISIRAGADRRERWVVITEAGTQKLEEVRPAWARAQERIRQALPAGTWEALFAALPDVMRAAATVSPGGS